MSLVGPAMQGSPVCEDRALFMCHLDERRGSGSAFVGLVVGEAHGLKDLREAGI